MAETFILKGCWKRKEVVHALVDKATVMKLANTHPWTINSTPSLKLEYTRLYGQAESDILMVKGKPNMVEAFESGWVQNGHKVEANPKPVPLPPDSNDLLVPFGTVRVPGDPGPPEPLDALIDRVMVSVLKRAGLWREIE